MGRGDADGLRRRGRGDLLVTGDVRRGWTLQSGSWTRLWRTITARQSHSSGDAWKKGGGRVVGAGEEASVLVPVDYHYNLQLVNARTGELATLGDAGPAKLSAMSDFRLALDGVIVVRSSKTMEAYDVTGRLVDTFEEGSRAYGVVPSEDGRAPTLAELKASSSRTARRRGRRARRGSKGMSAPLLGLHAHRRPSPWFGRGRQAALAQLIPSTALSPRLSCAPPPTAAPRWCSSGPGAGNATASSLSTWSTTPTDAVRLTDAEEMTWAL